MPISRKLLILPPVILGVAVLATVVATRPGPSRVDPEETATRVRVLDVAPTRFVPRLQGFGSVAPGRTWDAVAQVAGRIARVAPELKRGDTVRADAVIIEIANEDYQLAVAQADAEIGSAEAEIEELGLEESNLRASLEIERRALAIAENDLKRQRSLASRGTAAQASVDESELDVVRQRATVQDLENQLKLVPTQRRILELTRAVQESALATALLDLERTTIRAPFEGRVAASEVEATQYVAVGQTLATIDSIDVAEIEVQIPFPRMKPFAELAFGRLADPALTPTRFAEVAERARMSATVRLRFDDRDIEWPARVVRASDTVDPATRAIGLIVEVDNPYVGAVAGERPPLIKDMFVEVELRAEPIDGAIVIPRSAVSENAVYVVDGDFRLARRPIQAVRAFGDLVVVGGGLQPGDRLLLDDLSPAIPGMLLDPLPDPATDAWLRQAAGGDGDTR